MTYPGQNALDARSYLSASFQGSKAHLTGKILRATQGEHKHFGQLIKPKLKLS